MSQRAVESAPSLLVPTPDRTSDRGPTLAANFRKRLPTQGQPFILDVDFQAAPGFTILFGPSGAGKTTLLDGVAGIQGPDSGRITIAGRVLFDAAQGVNLSVADRRVGYV